MDQWNIVHRKNGADEVVAVFCGRPDLSTLYGLENTLNLGSKGLFELLQTGVCGDLRLVKKSRSVEEIEEKIKKLEKEYQQAVNKLVRDGVIFIAVVASVLLFVVFS